MAAGKLCTNIYEMKVYKHLALLLEHTGTLEADKNNQKDIKVFMKSEVEEKTKLFWKKMEPLLELKESVLEVSDTVINNAFTAFVKNNLMIKECRGQYLLNPKYFFRGTLSQRSKLKLQIEN